MLRCSTGEAIFPVRAVAGVSYRRRRSVVQKSSEERMQETVRVPLDQLVLWIRDVLAAEGVPANVRRVEAEIMAEADLHGVPSHGVRMLPGLVQAIRRGQAAADPEIRVQRDRGAAVVLDCGNGPGRYVSSRAMAEAISRARDHAVGLCLAIRTTHWGRAHAYAFRAARSGMVGLCTTNAVPNMCGWGSSRPILGNNPLAVGVPLGPTRDPIVLDMAMSQAAVGKVGTWLREGRKAPPGWGLDIEGLPTEDPARIAESGRLLPFGDHKGAGLAVIMELLTAGLSGGLLSQEIIEIDRTGLDPGATKLFLAIDPESLGEPDTLEHRADDLIAWLRARADSSITLPGTRGLEYRRRYLTEGIPIHAAIAATLSALEPPPPWTRR